MNSYLVEHTYNWFMSCWFKLFSLDEGWAADWENVVSAEAAACVWKRKNLKYFSIYSIWFFCCCCGVQIFQSAYDLFWILAWLMLPLWLLLRLLLHLLRPFRLMKWFAQILLHLILLLLYNMISRWILEHRSNLKQ